MKEEGGAEVNNGDIVKGNGWMRVGRWKRASCVLNGIWEGGVCFSETGGDREAIVCKGVLWVRGPVTIDRYKAHLRRVEDDRTYVPTAGWRGPKAQEGAHLTTGTTQE